MTYAVEILPYEIRAKGFAIFNLTIALALVFNQYVNPIALGKFSISSITYIVLNNNFRSHGLEVLCAFYPYPDVLCRQSYTYSLILDRLHLLACLRSHLPVLL